MTGHTPEKVAELVAYNRKWVQLHRENKYQREAAMRMGRALDALTAVSAERDATHAGWDADVQRLAEAHNARLAAEADRDRLHKAITEALDHDPLHGRSEGLHCGGMSPCIRGILRAALDKEGNDDE